jgi:hypothetical protein
MCRIDDMPIPNNDVNEDYVSGSVVLGDTIIIHNGIVPNRPLIEVLKWVVTVLYGVQPACTVYCTQLVSVVGCLLSADCARMGLISVPVPALFCVGFGLCHLDSSIL